MPGLGVPSWAFDVESLDSVTFSFPRQGNSSSAFGSLLNAEQHFSLHDEMGRFKNAAPENQIEEGVLEIGIEVSATANDQTRRVPSNFVFRQQHRFTPLPESALCCSVLITRLQLWIMNASLSGKGYQSPLSRQGAGGHLLFDRSDCEFEHDRTQDLVAVPRTFAAVPFVGRNQGIPIYQALLCEPRVPEEFGYRTRRCFPQCEIHHTVKVLQMLRLRVSDGTRAAKRP